LAFVLLLLLLLLFFIIIIIIIIIIALLSLGKNHAFLNENEVALRIWRQFSVASF